MTTKKPAPATRATSAQTAAPALIVFGMSDIGKPRAGTFPATQQLVAGKAAATMGLSILAIKDQKTRAMAESLPAGRITAGEKGFIPFVRENLFAELLTAAKDHGIKLTPAMAKYMASQAERAQKNAKGDPSLPKDWSQFAVGDLVLAQDSDPEDGWWRAIVIKTTGDMLSLQWQHRLSKRVFIRHKYNVGLICAGLAQGAAPAPTNTTSKYPAHPSVIAVNQTVLCPEDGPMQQFWEAIPVGIETTSVTLRWRDYDGLPAVKRPLSQLALICPEPGTKSVKASA